MRLRHGLLARPVGGSDFVPAPEQDHQAQDDQENGEDWQLQRQDGTGQLKSAPDNSQDTNGCHEAPYAHPLEVAGGVGHKKDHAHPDHPDASRDLDQEREALPDEQGSPGERIDAAILSYAVVHFDLRFIDYRFDSILNGL
jgi:hypothetical protein